MLIDQNSISALRALGGAFDSLARFWVSHGDHGAVCPLVASANEAMAHSLADDGRVLLAYLLDGFDPEDYVFTCADLRDLCFVVADAWESRGGALVAGREEVAC